MTVLEEVKLTFAEIARGDKVLYPKPPAGHRVITVPNPLTGDVTWRLIKD